MGLIFDHTTLAQRVLFGTTKAIEHVAIAIESLGAERLLLIADASAHESADRIAARVNVVARVDDVVQHVPAENARSATDVSRSSSADAVIAIGGGSAIGLTKIVALNTGLPIVAVPTTFAGSEATNVWGITDGQRKTTGVDDRVLPAVVVYDAALSQSLPERLAKASGLNALAHAVDSLWAPRADPINTAMGAEALRALVPGLRALSDDPADLLARERILYGAYLAAVAFASAGSGIHHKICHTLGGAYGLSHAEMHAIVLPYVMAFNAPAAPDAEARVTEVTGATSAAGGLHRLRTDLGVTGGLAGLGLRESDLAEAAELAFQVIPPSNPRAVTLGDIEGIIRSAWEGAAVA